MNTVPARVRRSCEPCSRSEWVRAAAGYWVVMSLGRLSVGLTNLRGLCHDFSMKLKHPLLLGLLMAAFAAHADSKSPPVSVAVMTFGGAGKEVSADAESLGVLVSTSLAASENLMLVERSELDRILAEQQLGASGNTGPESVAKVGQLTGARVLITGRVLPSGAKRILVAKVISAETGRMFPVTQDVPAGGESEAAEKLSGQILKIIEGKGDALFSDKSETEEQRTARLRKLVTDAGPLPKVYVSIPESHLTRRVPDPAAETEIARTLQLAGFPLAKDSTDAQRVIRGEAFSERGAANGAWVSCRARVEVTLTDDKGNKIAVDRQTGTAADIAENVAGKTALQRAGAIVGERLIAALVKR